LVAGAAFCGNGNKGVTITPLQVTVGFRMGSLAWMVMLTTCPGVTVVEELKSEQKVAVGGVKSTKTTQVLSSTVAGVPGFPEVRSK